MSLSPEVRDKYTGIIDGILATADLNTVSAKQIRKGIQTAVEYDITPQKTAIQELIMERFDEFNARQNGSNEGSSAEAEVADASPPPASPTTNGHVNLSPPPSKSPAKRQSDSDVSDIRDSAPPPKKRKADVDADAMMAARLQAEENARARPTRGGTTRKAASVKKRTPKKKTSTKVKAEDDSDLDDSDVENKPQRNTGFHKPLMLSPALSVLLDGEITLSRPQTVKRLWAHIKANDLQDPSDKRQIICDEPMRAVFKQDKVHMFTMTKILNQNLYTPDE